jgi:hypothetical protein
VLPAFLFDFAMLEQGGTFPKITQTAAQMVFYAAGPITIGILLCRFSDYQDWGFTVSQLLAFVLNLYMVVVFTRALTRKHRINASVALFSYSFAYVPIIWLVGLQFFWAINLAFSTKFCYLESRYHQIRHWLACLLIWLREWHLMVWEMFKSGGKKMVSVPI